MQSIAPSKSLARRARQYFQIAFVIIAAGGFLIALAVTLSIIRFAGLNDSLYNLGITVMFVIGVIILVIGLGIVIRALTWKTDNDLAKYTGQFLQTYFDERYTLVRNVSSRELQYIDAVLVGPPGALVFRLLNLEGEVANEGADWLKKNKNGDLVPLGFSPTRQVVEDVKRLRDYLAKKGLGEVPVFGVVVFVRDANMVRLIAKNPVVTLTHLSSTVDNLKDNYLAMERMPEPLVRATVRLLNRET